MGYLAFVVHGIGNGNEELGEFRLRKILSLHTARRRGTEVAHRNGNVQRAAQRRSLGTQYRDRETHTETDSECRAPCGTSVKHVAGVGESTTGAAAATASGSHGEEEFELEEGPRRQERTRWTAARALAGEEHGQGEVRGEPGLARGRRGPAG